MADAECDVGEVLGGAAAGFAVEAAVAAPKIAGVAVDFGFAGDAVAQACRADDDVAVSAVLAQGGGNGDVAVCAGLDINGIGGLGLPAFAVGVADACFQTQFAFVGEEFFQREGKVGGGVWGGKQNEKCNGAGGFHRHGFNGFNCREA